MAFLRIDAPNYGFGGSQVLAGPTLDPRPRFKNRTWGTLCRVGSGWRFLVRLTAWPINEKGGLLAAVIW